MNEQSTPPSRTRLADLADRYTPGAQPEPRKPAILPDDLDRIDSLFPVLRVLPGTTLDAIMFNAGQRSVVEKLREWAKR